MRRVSSIGAGLVLTAALGRVVPGCGASAFVCEGDESCEGLPDGQCEADGRCSVPDADCPSGRRYAAHSGDLSGHCVGEEATTGTGGTMHASETGDEPTSVDDGSTSSPPATTGTDTTGEPPLEACAGEVIVEEPFTALPLDPGYWEVFNDAGIAVNVVDGELRLSAIDAKVAYTDVGSTFPLPPAGSVGVELTAAPPSDVSAEAYLVLVELEVVYGFQARAGQLELFHDDGIDAVPVATLPYDPVAHRWLRLVFEASNDLLVWEAAPGIGEWERLGDIELEAGFDVDEASLYFGAGVWGGPLTAEPLAAFGHAFVCAE